MKFQFMSREVSGNGQRGVWQNTSVPSPKHLSAPVFGRFPLVKFHEESGVMPEKYENMAQEAKIAKKV